MAWLGNTNNFVRATNWEFAHRALIIGLIFAVAFGLYNLDHRISTVALAQWLGARLHYNPRLVSRLLLACASVLLFAAALLRTWASSYLRASVVYAAVVKADSLVAGGPYRHVRNPLYLANMPLALGMGAMID